MSNGNRVSDCKDDEVVEMDGGGGGGGECDECHSSVHLEMFKMVNLTYTLP